MNTRHYKYLLVALLVCSLGCRATKNLSVESVAGVYKLAPDHPRHSPSESCRFALSADGSFEYYETACMGWRNGAKGTWRLVGDTIHMEASDKYCRMLFEVEESFKGSPDSVYFEVYDANGVKDTTCSIAYDFEGGNRLLHYSKKWARHRSKAPLACFNVVYWFSQPFGYGSPKYCVKDTTNNHFVAKFDRKHVASLFERNDCLIRAVLRKDRLTVLDTSYNPNHLNPTGEYKTLQKVPAEGSKGY